MKRKRTSQNDGLPLVNVLSFTLLLMVLLYPSGMELKALIPEDSGSNQSFYGAEVIGTLGMEPLLADTIHHQAARLLAGLTSDIAPGGALQDGPWSGKLHLPLIFKNFKPALFAVVPYLQGLTQAVAQLAIQTAELALGTVTQGTSPTIDAGKVMGQNPAPGLYVAKGTAVNLVISTGPGLVNVPNVVGQSQSLAEGMITAFGLQIGTVTPEYSDTVDPGNITRQSPLAATSVPEGTAVNLWLSLGQQPIPPDPGTVAPPIDPTVATTVAKATEFLYTGASPIQGGVSPDTIEAKRAAVIRGKVLDREGQPLPGATVTIFNHPEFGQTLTRLDGMFDMAVNGGGLLTVNYQKPAYLPAQRRVNVPWQDYVRAPEVALVPLDTQVTQINLTAPDPFQVAQANTVTDTDGTRQATLLIPQGTSAQMVMPDGSTQPLTTLSIRATEYTVGPNGPKAMPGLLPPQSGYTYAVELSADEALSAGANSLRFNQPVFHYVENFLGFPVGGIVPVGYYDHDKAAWIPSDNGRVIKILNVPPGGLADVDTDGDDLADNGLGITYAERQQLGSLYSAGQSLWRVPIPHFSPWDCNWPYGLPDGAGGPGGGPPGGGSGSGGDGNCKSQCCEEGSIIGCQSQTMGEAIHLTGTRYKLHYRNERTPGYKADFTLRIPLSGASVPEPLERIDLEILVAGRIIMNSFPPTANQSHTFTWDGKDAYGRTLQGDQPVTVRIGYVYTAVYRTPAENDQAFAQYGEAITPIRERQEIVIWKEWNLTIGNWDARAQALGGWTLNEHHTFVPSLTKVLYLGNGERRSATGRTDLVITTVAGTGSQTFGGDGGPATKATLYVPRGVAVGPDGSLYIADSFNRRIRRVGPDGIITTVAGNGSINYVGDGVPATATGFQYPYSVAIGPDGSLYFTGPLNQRVFRVRPDGIIVTVAGNGTSGFGGDGGPATEALLRSPNCVVVGPDNSLYIADMGNQRIRRVSPDGTINTVAGNGLQDFPVEGRLATMASLNMPYSVALASDGSFYIADSFNNRIRRVGPDGIINTVAGNGIPGYAGDGGPATEAQLSAPYYVALGPDGSLYFSNTQIFGVGPTNRIRRVSPDGIINTIAGDGTAGFSGDGGPAAVARVSLPASVAVGPNGGKQLYIADTYNNRIRQVSSAIPGLVASDTIIPSENGHQLYVFDGQSRHRRTRDALTGTVQYEFSYDDAGLLTAVTDGAGNVTTIARDGAGDPTAIGGPYGQRTTLIVDGRGYLSSITNPAGEVTQLVHSFDGLLTRLTDPRGNIYNYTYDDMGRLIRDEDPSGGSKVLSQTNQGQDYTVTLGAGPGLATTYRVEGLATGGQRRVNTLPNGLQSEWVSRSDGTLTNRSPDGMETHLTFGPDPRWGMMAPVRNTLTRTTPGALSASLQTTRTATLTDPANILSLASLSETRNINGRNYTHSFSATDRLFTTTTPVGRQILTTVNDRRRPVRVQIAGLIPTDLSYDGRGRLATITTGQGPDMRTASLTYNPGGYLDTITDALGRTVTYQYDSASRVTRRTLPDGRIIQATYDANSNTTSIIPPGRPAHHFSYTPINLLSEYNPPDTLGGTGQTLYTYNLNRKLTLITRPDGQSVNFGYDSAGRPSTLTLPRGQVSYAFDGTTGRLANIAAPDGVTVTYTHDGSLRTGETWTGPVAGSITRTYDNNLRLTGAKVNEADTVVFEYDIDGLLTRAGDLTLSRNPQNGLLTGATMGTVSDIRIYNGFGELIGYNVSYGESPLFVQEYLRDKLRRITQKKETVAGEIHTYDHAYDLAGRLTEVRKDGALFASYSYDSNSNRLSGPSGTTTYTYDDQDRLLTRTFGPQTQTYSYTANGELLSESTGGSPTTYSYDALGNLMSVALPDGRQIDYLVDGRNRRIGKKVDGVLEQGFLYQAKLRPVAELDGAGNLVSRFVYATRKNVPDYMAKGGFTYRIITDHLGSPRLVANVATGEIAQRMDYDEFGVVTNDTNPGFQPFGYAGGLYDRHTGFVRFGARDYDAETGRWTAKDLILFSGRDTNLYGYVRNDPINGHDPTGLAPEFIEDWREGGIAALDALTPDADDGLAFTILSPLWLVPCGITIGYYGVAVPTLLEDLTHWVPPGGLFGVPFPEDPEEWTPGPGESIQCYPDDSMSPEDQECVGDEPLNVVPGYYPAL